ncbi:putative alcohol dehydrogenase [Podospora appendiculata]|uniref:Alcohol dehydrogenase n=1 Tax=Podospora appendiculata TaxID=314037 RepID=A0AAE0XCP0_9PEZI|nr:putative alcohol dehydrogenase [Podospora appendiculata]
MSSPSSSTQKAVAVTKVGQPVELITDRAVPEPGPHEVQLKVSVAGLNPVDYQIRDYGLFISDLPAVIGFDVVGRVSKLGEGVTGLKVGDRIVSQAASSPGNKHNALQEYALAKEGFIGLIPDSISDDEAATLPTTVVAGLVAIFAVLQIPAPWTDAAKDFDYASAVLLIVGGGSHTGRHAVQLAALAGIGKIVVVGGNETDLEAFGATHVLDRYGGDEVVLQRIKDVVGDDLIYALDTVNPPAGQVLALNALSSHKKGVLARLLPTGPVDESKVIGKKAGFEVKDVYGSTHANPELGKAFWARLPGLLAAGKIKASEYDVKQGLEASYVNTTLDAYRAGKKVAKPNIHIV